VRILQITAAYKPAFVYGGPTMSVAMLCEQLAAAGIYTEVYTTTANGKEDLSVISGKPVDVDGVTVTYFRRLTGDHTHFSPSLLWALWKTARNFDLIHIHAWWNTVSVLSCLVAVMRGTKVVLSPRGTLSAYSFSNKNINSKKLIHELLGKALLKRCAIHATSEREARAVKTSFGLENVFVVPNFVSLPDMPHKVDRIADNILRMTFFSRIEQKKGLDLLINALPAIDFKYRLSIAGNGDAGYIQDLKLLAKKNAVDQNIDWVGFLQNDKFEFLAGQDMLVLASHDENFANVVIEALSEGTAVLITRQVGLSDYVADRNLGWICEPSAGSIADELEAIQKQPEVLKQIRLDAPIQIRKDFDNHESVQRYLAMYQNII
jgi:glycosyltransferase involved in cell wall biosynthesis